MSDCFGICFGVFRGFLASIALLGLVSGYAAVTAELGQNNTVIYGGQIDLNVGFDPTWLGIAR